MSLLPLALLMVALGVVVYCFGSDSLGGASQTALMLVSAVVVAISILVYKNSYAAFERAIADMMSSMANALLILFFIGGISSTWMCSGVVPLLIQLGMHIINPTFFLPVTCAITAAVSVLTGSSWTTIATIGLALEGIGQIQGYGMGWIAGAIISGAYFGDKISPLSDTTVLASSSTGVPIFTHIRYLLITTIPSLTIALLVFLVGGMATTTGAPPADRATLVDALSGTYNMSPWLLIVPALTGVMIWRRMPSTMVLFLGIVLGVIAEMVFQPQLMRTLAEGDAPFPLLRGALTSVFAGSHVSTGVPSLDTLVATGGMAGMLNTVWLIVCAVTFGACMQAAGMLQTLTEALFRVARGVTGMVSSAVLSAFMLNVLTGDQYTAILLGGQMFKNAFREKALEARLLSRCLEDGGTVTSVLVPWNTCGMTQSTVLGVSTLTYLPYCVFNYVSPLMSILVAALGYKIVGKTKSGAKPAVTQENDSKKIAL